MQQSRTVLPGMRSSLSLPRSFNWSSSVPLLGLPTRESGEVRVCPSRVREAHLEPLYLPAASIVLLVHIFQDTLYQYSDVSVSSLKEYVLCEDWLTSLKGVFRQSFVKNRGWYNCCVTF